MRIKKQKKRLHHHSLDYFMRIKKQKKRLLHHSLDFSNNFDGLTTFPYKNIPLHSNPKSINIGHTLVQKESIGAWRHFPNQD